MIPVSPAYKFIKYSSSWSNDAAGSGHGRGRLYSPQAWSAGRNAVGEWMQFDLGRVDEVSGITTQRRGDYNGQFVSSYKVMTSPDGKKWDWVECGRIFEGNDATNPTDMEVRRMFEFPIHARYVRIVVQSWNQHISMRAGVLTCEQPCKKKQLDYSLQRTLLSTSDGPALAAPWF